MEHINQNSNIVNSYNLTFDSVISKILNVLPLHSDSVVFSGLHLIEQHYIKYTGSSRVNNQDKIDIFVFGTEQTILNKVYQIAKCLETIENLGSLTFIEQTNTKLIRFKFENSKKIINVICCDCANVNELMNSFETANEMMYWTPETGLVISPFAKMTFEMNQVMSNFKFKGDISNQNLYNLKTIGFELTEYIKNNLFVSNKYISPTRWLTCGWYTKYQWENFTKFINTTTIKNYIQSGKTDPGYTNFSGDIDADSIRIFSINGTYIPYPKYKSANDNKILLQGWIGQVIKISNCVYISFFVSDNKIANKLIHVFNYYQSYISNYAVNMPILNTKFFVETSTKIKFKQPQLNEKISKQLENYSNKTNLGLLCKLVNTTNIVDTRSNNFKNIGSDYCNIPLNTPVYMWAVFHANKLQSNNLESSASFIVI